MAKNTQPIAKRCKALGISPAVMGYAKKTTERNTKGQMRRKQSEYGLQLNEKQKVKFVYGVLEKQFRYPLDGYVYELLEPTKALLLRYKALCEEKGSQLMILLFPNLTAHALAEPEYLPYCESLMAFCRENGIPCYNFQYVKADYMENLDAYYYDLYHLNGEGADKFSAFFARFFNAYVGGEDVDGWFYADSAEYLASVDRVTNAWLMRRSDQFVADCNRGTQVTPLYRFCLSTDGVQTLLRDYSEDNTLPVSAVPAGSSVFVYAVPAGQPDAEPVFDMIWSSELGAYGT